MFARRYLKRFLVAATAGFAFLWAPSSWAGPKTDFKVCWTIYAGWMPWDYAKRSGIMDKWARKYGIKVDVVQLNDYVESINQYSAGAFDGCTMTNMDALTIPAAGGVDTTALIIGDFSNGNDGVVMKGDNKKIADLKGKQVNLVELSVSHYLLARALETQKMSERDVRVVNTSDADMVAAFKTKGVDTVVTWNPLLAEVMGTPKVSKLFDSSQIPGEIIDLMVVNTKTLNENPNFGKALVGIWYETLGLMQGDTPEAKAANARKAMIFSRTPVTDRPRKMTPLTNTRPRADCQLTPSQWAKARVVSASSIEFDQAEIRLEDPFASSRHAQIIRQAQLACVANLCQHHMQHQW